MSGRPESETAPEPPFGAITPDAANNLEECLDDRSIAMAFAEFCLTGPSYSEWELSEDAEIAGVILYLNSWATVINDSGQPAEDEVRVTVDSAYREDWEANASENRHVFEAWSGNKSDSKQVRDSLINVIESYHWAFTAELEAYATALETGHGSDDEQSYVFTLTVELDGELKTIGDSGDLVYAEEEAVGILVAAGLMGKDEAEAFLAGAPSAAKVPGLQLTTNGTFTVLDLLVSQEDVQTARRGLVPGRRAYRLDGGVLIPSNTSSRVLRLARALGEHLGVVESETVGKDTGKHPSATTRPTVDEGVWDGDWGMLVKYDNDHMVHLFARSENHRTIDPGTRWLTQDEVKLLGSRAQEEKAALDARSADEERSRSLGPDQDTM